MTVAVSVWVVPIGLSPVGGSSVIVGCVASQRLVTLSWGSLASLVLLSFESTKAVIVSGPALVPV